MSHAHVAYRAALAQKRGSSLQFLDVGCGGGIKVLLAAGLFDQAVGFDYDEAYVQATQTSFAQMGAKRCYAFWGNGLEYENYADFDVIYLFKPMSDPRRWSGWRQRSLTMPAPARLWWHRIKSFFCATRAIIAAVFRGRSMLPQSQRPGRATCTMRPAAWAPMSGRLTAPCTKPIRAAARTVHGLR